MRPAHFSDGHTASRQQWLADLQADSNTESLRGMQMLAWTIGIALAVTAGVIVADWMTGESIAEQVIAWRATA